MFKTNSSGNQESFFKHKLLAGAGVIALSGVAFPDTPDFRLDFHKISSFTSKPLLQMDLLLGFNPEVTLRTDNFIIQFDPKFIYQESPQGAIKYQDHRTGEYAIVNAANQVFAGSEEVANRGLQQLREKYPKFKSRVD